ncbi:RluA family pseudouridine synthase [uncultured Piscinibacter sp.]|uniref:RluA family pseudouridine synthase n=1 Tax=uncultured Piscinibacter sp. TaxID=1131835 RepID=UPI0026042C90|nr:RluA family pseudouridine synthase [uncultured Piscinibacter sp.]
MTRERDYREETLDDGGESERRAGVAPVDWHGQRLDKALVAMAPEFSRSHLQGLLERGHVWVGGVQARAASQRVRCGQRIEIELIGTEESRAFRPEAMALAIVHEDEHLLVIDKPAGMVVHPAAGNWSGTLLNGLLAHHAGASALPRAGIVHRLDKDTSGLMVVAKTLVVMTALVRAIAGRAVHRQYMALCHGELSTGAFSIEAPIGRDPQSRVRMAVVAGGKPARTDVERVAASGGFSAVRCTLHTGRTHQIRVHLASRGHPLVADALYGGAPALGMARQALHAFRLGFVHPVSGEDLRFEAPPPPDLAAAWGLVTGAG